MIDLYLALYTVQKKWCLITETLRLLKLLDHQLSPWLSGLYGSTTQDCCSLWLAPWFCG